MKNVIKIISVITILLSFQNVVIAEPEKKVNLKKKI